MNSLFEAGLELQEFMDNNRWPFCYIGGLAVIRWGEPRMTQDIDLAVLSGFGNEQIYIQRLLGTFISRIPNAPDFALKNRVLLVSASNRVPVDISLGGLPFEEEMIERATPFAFADKCPLRTCSAEDLIVLKAFADRARDWSDIETIIIRQGKDLDVQYIQRQLTPLCVLKEAPEIVDKLTELVDHMRE